MNLTSMLRDESLANLTWLNNKETFEPQGKDTDQKDDLAIEWGRGDATVEDRPHTNIQNEMKVRNQITDVETLLDYAQVLLHQGITKKETMRQVKLRFPIETINAAGDDLVNILKLDGIVGSVVIDLRHTKRPALMVQAAMKSPYRKHIAYVIMRQADVEKSAMVKEQKTACEQATDGSIDGYFAAPAVVEQTTRWVYKPLNLPVITSRAELDEEYYDSTLIDLVNTTGLTETEAKDIYRAEGNVWSKLKKAFRAVTQKRLAHDAPSTRAADHSADFKMKASLDVQVNAANRKRDLDVASVMVTGPMEEIDPGTVQAMDVDGQAAPDSFEVGIDAAIDPNYLDSAEVMTPSEMTEVDPGCAGDVEVDTYGPVNEIEVEMQDAIDPEAPAEVDGIWEQPDVPLEAPPPPSIDVDESVFQDEEFEGTDIVDLDDVKPYSELEVSPEAELEV